MGFCFFFFLPPPLLPFSETPCRRFWRRAWVSLAPRSRGSVLLPPCRRARGCRGALRHRRSLGKTWALGLLRRRVMGGQQGTGGYFLFYFITFIFSAATAGKECSLKFLIGVSPPASPCALEIKDPDKQLWGAPLAPVPLLHARPLSWAVAEARSSPAPYPRQGSSMVFWVMDPSSHHEEPSAALPGGTGGEPGLPPPSLGPFSPPGGNGASWGAGCSAPPAAND